MTFLARKEVQFSPSGYGLDELVERFGFAAVLAPRLAQNVAQRGIAPERPALDPDEAEFALHAHPRAHADPLFVPDQRGLVLKTPCFHEVERIRQETVGRPQEQHTIVGGGQIDCRDVLEAHFRVWVGDAAAVWVVFAAIGPWRVNGNHVEHARWHLNGTGFDFRFLPGDVLLEPDFFHVLYRRRPVLDDRPCHFPLLFFRHAGNRQQIGFRFGHRSRAQ